MNKAKAEILRRLRLGDLRKLLRSRYGHALPDDDAGREDLHELLLPISLGPEAVTLKMVNAIEIWAPWMSRHEAEQLIGQINRMPLRERMPTGRKVGQRQQVSNQERELWKLWTVAPCDMTAGQLHEQRKAKKRASARRRRNRQPRDVYLANSRSKTKPWQIRGISRATWYRQQQNGHETGVSPELKSHETGVSPTKLSTTGDTPVSPEKLKGRKRLANGRRLH